MIAVLLSTYNGAGFLRQQMDSLLSQSYANIEIFVRDDGSTDETLQILSDYSVTLLPISNNIGAKGSFEVLMNYALEHSAAEYFMFCDQDDVWHEDKVEKAYLKMQGMKRKHDAVPLLVYSDLEVVDEFLVTISASMWNYEHTLPDKNSFSRLLIQNIITGCTVMINRKLAEKCHVIPDGAVMHDWWLGLVASYFGKVGYINEATIKYRQHGMNVIGAKRFKLNAIMNCLALCKGLMFRNNSYLEQLGSNTQQARAFLETFERELDSTTKSMLIGFINLDKMNFLQRRWVLFKYKLFKQGFIRNAGLFVRI